MRDIHLQQFTCGFSIELSGVSFDHVYTPLNHRITFFEDIRKSFRYLRIVENLLEALVTLGEQRATAPSKTCEILKRIQIISVLISVFSIGWNVTCTQLNHIFPAAI